MPARSARLSRHSSTSAASSDTRGARYTVYIAPETGRLMRQESTGAFAHYQPEPGTDLSVAIGNADAIAKFDRLCFVDLEDVVAGNDGPHQRTREIIGADGQFSGQTRPRLTHNDQR